MTWKITILHIKRKIWAWIGIRTLDLQTSNLALYDLSFPGSIRSTSLNLSLESPAMQDVVVCHILSSFDRRTNFVFIYLFIYSDVLNQSITKYKVTICALRNYNFRFQERHARDIEVRVSNPGPKFKFSLEI